MSVDPPEATIPWAQAKGFTFAMASDPDLQLIGALDLVNPDEPGLALHAAFIVDEAGIVFYRKIARRRVQPAELLDAIDYRYRRGRFGRP